MTGASSGLGWAYAEWLAARGHPLMPWRGAKTGCRRWPGGRARATGRGRAVVADLATEEGLAPAAPRSTPGARSMVLNAGFGSNGTLWQAGRAREADMVRLNCVAVVDLAAHALPGMVARGRGALVVVSSAAACSPCPAWRPTRRPRRSSST